MKKRFILIFPICFLTTNITFAVTTFYDRYGPKTGSYKKTSSDYNFYDKYGSKTGSFKTDSSRRTIHYDKYCKKLEVTNRFSFLLVPAVATT